MESLISAGSHGNRPHDFRSNFPHPRPASEGWNVTCAGDRWGCNLPGGYPRRRQLGSFCTFRPRSPLRPRATRQGRANWLRSAQSPPWRLCRPAVLRLALFRTSNFTLQTSDFFPIGFVSRNRLFSRPVPPDSPSCPSLALFFQCSLQVRSAITPVPQTTCHSLCRGQNWACLAQKPKVQGAEGEGVPFLTPIHETRSNLARGPVDFRALARLAWIRASVVMSLLPPPDHKS